MKARVFWTDSARLDLYDACEFIAGDDLAAALKLSEQVEKAIARLSIAPNRGRYVPELDATPVATEYRELIIRHLRVIYKPAPGVVWVHGIFDSRRDLEAALMDRLLRKS